MPWKRMLAYNTGSVNEDSEVARYFRSYVPTNSACASAWPFYVCRQLN